MAKKDRDDAAVQDESEETSRAVNDAWTGMLAISLLALMIGTGLLAWDYLSYPEEPPKTPNIAGASPGAPPKAAPQPAPQPVKDAAPKN